MKTYIRISRKDRVCYDCNKVIKKGTKYRSVVLFPTEEPYLSDVPIRESFCYPTCGENECQ